MGLLSGARGVIFVDREAAGTLQGILTPLVSQGAAYVFVERRTPAPKLDDILSCLCDEWGQIDFLVHCAMPLHTRPKDDPYFKTDLAVFQSAIACYVHGFVAIARRAACVMAPGGSLLSLNGPIIGMTCPGNGLFEVILAAQAASVRCLAEDLGPKGIRVNAITAGRICPGPLKTIASRHSLPFSGRHRAPLRRDVTPEEIGKSAAYLLSGLSSGTTGETLHVDAGHHVIGLRGVEPP
ncbi:SDR family oxidoreductase [Roseinatronobacter sp. NSM]|uniref:SDR family oxidoreductase n=1 Tax=Roseinatronobacter sp. NSM TaxID=3457785 RepID=UPI004035CE6D